MKIEEMKGRFKDEIIELTAKATLRVVGLSEQETRKELKSLMESWIMAEHHIDVLNVTQEGDCLSTEIRILVDLGTPQETSLEEFNE